MATLELQSLSKSYTSQITPVKALDLTVEAGEFLTLLGPSGCGKSTILRLIAGLEQPTSGQILIEGKVVNSLGAGDRNVAMVFQSYALYPHMTVYDNIASGLKLRKLPTAQIQQRIAQVSDFLGLATLLGRKPAQLSGGQRQRVAVARALVREPALFLLDEPLSNLDALLREQVRSELKQLFANQAAPVIYVTHDQTEAMTLSSRVAVLNQGELQQLDTPAQIYNQPANQFVAGFIGSPQMNFVTLALQGGQAQLGALTLPAPSQEAIGVLGIRPEHLRLTQGEEGGGLRGEVTLVENLGMGKLVTLRLVEGQPYTLRALLPADGNYERGDRLPLVLPLPLMHWFHPVTGQRLNC